MFICCKYFRLVISSLLLIPSLSLSAQTSTNGLVGYWSFDEGTGATTRDLSGHGNDGAIQGATWMAGRVGKALQFRNNAKTNDAPQLLNCGTGASLNLTNAFSISLWLRLEQFPWINGGTVIAKGRGYTSGGSYSISVGPDGGLMNIFLRDPSNTNYAHLGLNSGQGNATPPPRDRWFHFALTFDGGTGTVYFDGVQSAQTTFTAKNLYVAPSLPLQIGAYDKNDNFSGIIDEVKVYDRAIAIDEIRAEYLRGSQPWIPPTIDLFGNYHTLGLMLVCSAADDPDKNATATLEYRMLNKKAFRQAFPLSRVNQTHFIGSLFWLTPGTPYEVKVTFKDPDGGPLDGYVATAQATTRMEPAIPKIPAASSANKAYYVNPAINQTGDGSVNKPFRSIREAVEKAKAGDQVILRNGVYYDGDIILPHPGQAGLPIVIRAFPGEKPIMDGSFQQPFNWEKVPDHPEISVTTLDESLTWTHLILADGERLYRYHNLPDLLTLQVADRKNLKVNLPGYCIQTNRLYLNLKGKDPSKAQIILSCRKNAFVVTHGWIYFVGLTFRYYGMLDFTREWLSSAGLSSAAKYNAAGSVIHMMDAHDCLVQDCTFAVNDLGLYVECDSSRLTVQDNEFFDCIYHWPWSATKGQSLETGGIRVYSRYIGRGLVVRRNVFHDFFDGLCICSYNSGPFNNCGLSNETDMYENLLYNCGDDGVEADGQCANIRIWKNVFRECYSGISLAPAKTGPVYCLRNIFYGKKTYKMFKISNNYWGPMYLIHNTSYAACGQRGLCPKDPWELLFTRNNIWFATDTGNTHWGYAINLDAPKHSLDLDYDNYVRTWAIRNTNNVLGLWRNQPATLKQIQENDRQLLHGFANVDPAFLNPTNGVLSLKTNSPMIDAGIHIPGINDDFAGDAPDLGALEYYPVSFLKKLLNWYKDWREKE